MKELGDGEIIWSERLTEKGNVRIGAFWRGIGAYVAVTPDKAKTMEQQIRDALADAIDALDDATKDMR